MPRFAARRRLFLLALLVAMDMGIAMLSLFVASMMRIAPGTGFSLDFLTNPELSTPYIHLVLFAPFGRFFANSLLGYYRPGRRRRSAPGDVFDQIKSVSAGSAILILMAFLYRGVFFEYQDFAFSRFVLLLDWLFTLFLITSSHSLIRVFADELHRRGYLVTRIGIQGMGPTAKALAEAMHHTPELQHGLQGFIADEAQHKLTEEQLEETPFLGKQQDIREVINTHDLEEVVITNPAALEPNLADFVDTCHSLDVVVMMVPDLYGIAYGRSAIHELAGMPTLQLNEIGIRGFRDIIKRIEDIVLALIALVLVSPLLLIATIAVKLESPGPAIFRQSRLGKNGRYFPLLKLRSMCDNAEELRGEIDSENEADGILFKIKSDPRITRVGKFIRKTSIDELPQLLNVLRGDMSLVGPRPMPATDVEGEDAWKHARLSVRPGITGLWQVNRTDHTSEEMFKWDIIYIETWSPWLDARILWKTIFVVLTGKGAY